MPCNHYSRKCSIISPCCNKMFPCRICHDQSENHLINRKEIIQIKCNNCNLTQYVQEECMNCEIRFAKYICLACKLFDDNDKQQFHCTQCGICRVGGRENFKHCRNCGMCIQVSVKNHKCFENSGYSECPLCLEDIHSSVETVQNLSCGHYIHSTCFQQLVQNNDYKCPLCRKEN